MMSEGEFVDVRPHAAKPRRDRREHRHLRHDRLAGEERAVQQRQGRACGASRIPAFTPRSRHDRRASRAEGRLAAGAGDRVVHRRRLPPQRRALPRRTRSTSTPTSASRGRRRRSRAPSLRARARRRLRLLPRRWARSRTRTRSYLTARSRLERLMQHAALRRLLEGARSAAVLSRTSSPPCSRWAAGSTPRTAAALSRRTARSRSRAPRAENVLVMGPWRHGGWARTEGDRLGDVSFGAKTSHFYREHIELPFFEHHLKGEDGAQPEASVFETGHERVAHVRPRGRPEAKPATLYLPRRTALSATAAERAERGDDAYVERSDQAGAVPAAAERHDRRRVHDRRSALRRAPAGRARLPDAPLEGDVTLAGPINASSGCRRPAPTRTSW